MPKLQIMTAAEQVAAYLRAEMTAGRMLGVMPGVLRLEADYGINRNTLETALRLLENEGLLISQGAGMCRLIRPQVRQKKDLLRVGILTNDEVEQKVNYMVELRHQLTEAGHSVFFLPKGMYELEMDVRRIARMVKRYPADVWLVIAGSREVLEWFANEKLRVMAIFGRRRELPIASVGPDKVPAIAAATSELIRLGHRRIVLLTRRARRLPLPGAVEQEFLNQLANHGIVPGPYNLPDWQESIDGYQSCLESLFHVTPPTAMIIDEVPLFLATQQYLITRGLQVPRDVSLICMDESSELDWCRPSVAHIRWDSMQMVRRVLRWTANMAVGKIDLSHNFTTTEFVNGGTIGMAKRS